MAFIRKIEKQSGTRYKVIVKRAGRVVSAKVFTTWKAADAHRRRVEGDADLQKALGTAGARTTVGEVVKAYNEEYERGGHGRAGQIDWWLDALGESTTLLSIGTADVLRELDRYATNPVTRYVGGGKKGGKVKALDRKRSNASINRMAAALSSLFRFAAGKGLFTGANPVASIQRREEARAPDRVLSDEEVAKVIEAARADTDHPRLHILVRFGLETGARFSEIINLTWPDLDLQARTADVRETKNGDPRRIVIPPTLAKELKALRLQSVGDGYVFPAPRNPAKPWTAFRSAYYAALTEAGLTPGRKTPGGVGFHTLRHSATTKLASAGVDVLTLATMVGHRSIQTTKRYTHLGVDKQMAAADRVFGPAAEEKPGA